MALVEAYFDESGTHEGSKTLVVAGYIFERQRAVALDVKWREMLTRYRLPYFHMSDCASDPGHGPFKGLTKQERIASATEAIELIKTHLSLGVAISVELASFPLIPRYKLYNSPYTFACWQALLAVRNWANTNNFTGDIAYFFESGHQHEGESNRLMTRLFKDSVLKKEYRYVAHAFVDRRRVALVQPPDILAWHCYHQSERQRAGNPIFRADLHSLTERKSNGEFSHVIADFDEARVKVWIEQIKHHERFLSWTKPLCRYF